MNAAGASLRLTHRETGWRHEPVDLRGIIMASATLYCDDVLSKSVPYGMIDDLQALIGDVGQAATFIFIWRWVAM